MTNIIILDRMDDGRVAYETDIWMIKEELKKECSESKGGMVNLLAVRLLLNVSPTKALCSYLPRKDRLIFPYVSPCFLSVSGE